MFYHAVHLLNHGSALESGTLGLHGAQFCALAGERDAGVVCTCASRVLSCPEPAIVGTTKGLKVDLPELGNKSSVKSWLAKHPNNAFLVRVRGVRVRGSARRACGARAVQRACDCATAKGVGPGCGRCEHGLRCGCRCQRDSGSGVPSAAVLCPDHVLSFVFWRCSLLTPHPHPPP